MSFRGLIVLLDEAISAADEKGLRKDWQKDMRGLLGAAVKQNKRAYTKRAAMPPAPKKADATKSPADQMKNAQRGNTGSSGSDVEGPKGGNRSSGFSGSLGSLGGGGGGGSSGGGMRGGGGGGAPANIDIKGTKQPAKDSKVDLLADAVKKGPSGPQDATKLIKLLNANGSKFAKAIVKAIEESSPKGRPTFRKVDYSYVTVEIAVEVYRWNGAYDFIVGFELEPGKSAKNIHFHDDNVQVSEVLGGGAGGEDSLEEGDIISDEDFIRRVNEPNNSLADVYANLTNNDGYLVDSVLADYKDPVVRAVGKALRGGSEWTYHSSATDFTKKTGGAELVMVLYVMGPKYYDYSADPSDLPGPQMYVTLYAKDDSNEVVVKQALYRKKGTDEWQKISMESATDLLVLRSKIFPADKAYDDFAEGNPKPLLKILSDAGGALAKVSAALSKTRPTAENLSYVSNEPVGAARYSVSAMPYSKNGSSDTDQLLVHFTVALPKANAILRFVIDAEASGKLAIGSANLSSAKGYEYSVDVAKVLSLLVAG